MAYGEAREMKVRRIIIPLVFFFIGLLAGIALNAVKMLQIQSMMKPSAGSIRLVGAVTMNRESVPWLNNYCEIYLADDLGNMLLFSASAIVYNNTVKNLVFDERGRLYLLESIGNQPLNLWRVNLPWPKLTKLKIPEIKTPDDTGKFLALSLSNYSTSVILVFEKKLIITDLVNDRFEIVDLPPWPKDPNRGKSIYDRTSASHASDTSTVLILDKSFGTDVGPIIDRIFSYDIKNAAWNDLGNPDQGTGGTEIEAAQDGIHYVMVTILHDTFLPYPIPTTVNVYSNGTKVFDIPFAKALSCGKNYLLSLDVISNSLQFVFHDFDGNQVGNASIPYTPPSRYYATSFDNLNETAGAIFEIPPSDD